MNKAIAFFTSLLFLPCLLFSNEAIPRPWQVDLKGYHMLGSKSTTEPYKENKLSVSHAVASAMYTQYLNMDGDGLIGEVAFSHLYLDWKKNPDVSTKDFNDLLFTAGGFTTKVPDWFWIGSLQIQVDAASFDFSNNARYRGFLQGRHQYTKDLDLYVGLLFYTHLQKEDVYPVLGFEYQQEGARWKIRAILPLDSYVMYSLTDAVMVSLEHRFIQERRRLKDNEGLNTIGGQRRHHGICDFRSQCVELAVRYQPFEHSYGKLFFGGAFGSLYRTYDVDGQNKRNYRFKPSPVFGIAGSFSF